MPKNKGYKGDKKKDASEALGGLSGKAAGFLRGRHRALDAAEQAAMGDKRKKMESD